MSPKVGVERHLLSKVLVDEVAVHLLLFVEDQAVEHGVALLDTVDQQARVARVRSSVAGVHIGPRVIVGQKVVNDWRLTKTRRKAEGGASKVQLALIEEVSGGAWPISVRAMLDEQPHLRGWRRGGERGSDVVLACLKRSPAARSRRGRRDHLRSL